MPNRRAPHVNGDRGLPRRRMNGFSPPYSKAQVAAWVAFGLTLIEFPIVVSPLMPPEVSIPVTAAFFAVAISVMYYGAVTQLVNPMDVHVLASQRRQQQPSEKQSALYRWCNPCPPSSPSDIPQEPMKQCWICDMQVAEHSMHCKFCNKCVGHFDHHCMWLNTCVGKANYLPFFRTMVSIFCMELIHFVVQMFLLVDGWTDGPGGTAERTDSWLWTGDGEATEAVRAVLIFFIVFNAVSIILLGQLLVFHVKLQRRGLSTYQYIVDDHRRKRDMNKLLDEMESDRIQQLQAARQSGDGSRVRALRLGRFCRYTCGMSSCDPLQPPAPVSQQQQQQEQQQQTRARDKKQQQAEPTDKEHHLDEETGNGGLAAAAGDDDDGVVKAGNENVTAANSSGTKSLDDDGVEYYEVTEDESVLAATPKKAADNDVDDDGDGPEARGRRPPDQPNGGAGSNNGEGNGVTFIEVAGNPRLSGSFVETPPPPSSTPSSRLGTAAAAPATKSDDGIGESDVGDGGGIARTRTAASVPIEEAGSGIARSSSTAAAAPASPSRRRKKDRSRPTAAAADDSERSSATYGTAREGEDGSSSSSVGPDALDKFIEQRQDMARAKGGEQDDDDELDASLRFT